MNNISKEVLLIAKTCSDTKEGFLNGFLGADFNPVTLFPPKISPITRDAVNVFFLKLFMLIMSLII
jgi:hypothetical protein